MKTLIPFSVLPLLVGLLSGCVREEMVPGASAGRVLNVSYSFDTPKTRVTATGAEREVKDVAIFFYRADDNHPNQETYVDCQAATVPEGSGSSGSFPLPLPATITPGMKYKLIVIGNYHKYRPEGKSLTEYAEQYNTRTYTKMKDEIQAQLATDGARVTAPLPFWGRLLGQDGNETVLTGPAPTDTDLGVSVKFSRAVARIDVTNLAADRLNIVWAKVCNYRNRGYFFNEDCSVGEIVRGTSATDPGAALPPGYVEAPPPSGNPGSLRQTLNAGGLYAFSNSVAYTSQDDKVTTCLLIAGYYQDPKETTPNTTKLTYYRANVSENGSKQFLRRNYIYTVLINNVKKEGSETEDGSVNEKEQLLSYEVGDDWESDDGNTTTDAAGNYLTLSRTSVVLDADKDASALIKVAVKKGTVWKPVWKENPENAFRFEKVSDNSFNILTTGKNETTFTRNAKLTVSVTGLATPLELTVGVIQLSSGNDPQMLAVEGRLGAFDYTVPGQGGELSLQVITGSPTSQWKAEADNDLDRCISRFTPGGANKGFIDLSFLANTGAARQGTLTVKRLLPDGVTEDASVAPVLVTFKQGKSPYVVSLLPNYSVSGLTVDGFLDGKGTPNGVSQNVRFSVLLADPAHYKFTATCSFNKASDAFITKGNPDITTTAGPLQTSKTNPSTISGIHGEDIWLNVFRTGPGDGDIKGTLEVKAVPKDPATAAQYPEAVYSVPITIKTGCKIGDSMVDSLLFADRNVGTTPRGEGGAAVGLNYSNDVNSDDNANTGFKGSYYSFAQAPAACATFGITNKYEGDLATGWRLPNLHEQQTVALRIYFSKQRGYIVSDDKKAGTVGCWFPLSGYTASPTSSAGCFWSSTPCNYLGYYLGVYTGSADTGSNNSNATGYSVRCVRNY